MSDIPQRFVEAIKFSSVVHSLSGAQDHVWFIAVGAILVSGIVVGMFGHKIHKVAIIGGGMAFGALLMLVAKNFLPDVIDNWIWIAVPAVLFGGLAYAMFQTAISFLGAGIGGALGWAIADTFMKEPEKIGIAIAIGIVVGGASAFIFKRPIVTAISSLIGSYAVVLATVVILKKVALEIALRILEHDSIPKMLIISTAIVMFIFQYVRLPETEEEDEKKPRKKRQMKVIEDDEESE